MSAAEVANDPPAHDSPPATLTVRRSWALGGAIAAVIVILALAVSLALAVGDDGRDGEGGPGFGGPPAAGSLPGAVPEGVPESGYGAPAPYGEPPEGFAPGAGVPEAVPPGMSGGASGDDGARSQGSDSTG